MDVIFLIELLPKSATNIFPALSTAILYGILNKALEPTPLANPAVILPANVTTLPFFVILRMQLLRVSAT